MVLDPLTNGGTQASGEEHQQQSGGGVWGEPANAVVANCVLVGNSTFLNGGGASGSTLNNCTLTDNSAPHGSGARDSHFLTWRN